ncbi:cytidylate kinase family protein [Candidatus Woesearchaeota archaeon]|nr:cytidylate kinase family protein [Candidatus Woesearchaeota archaeon]
MIITISGIAGSGKSTVAVELAKALGLKHYSIGSLMREMAKERGMSLLELGKLAEKDPAIDKALDEKQIGLGKKKDDFVIDSRLGFHFIPHSFKVFLEVALDEAAKRIFKQGRLHESYKDIDESLEKIRERITSEDKRYRQYYRIDYHEKGQYDLVIDTTALKVPQVVEKVIRGIRKTHSNV